MKEFYSKKGMSSGIYSVQSGACKINISIALTTRKKLSIGLRETFGMQKGYSHVAEEGNIGKGGLLPLDLRHNIGLSKDSIDKKELPSRLRKGFNSYTPILKISNISSKSEKVLLSELQKVIKTLEKDKIYSVLVHTTGQGNKSRGISIFPEALFIHSRTSSIEFGHYILRRLRIYESKYTNVSSYGLILTVRIWYTKEELKGLSKDLRYKKICSQANKTLVYKEKQKDFLNKSISYIKKKGEHIRLTPFNIANLKAINGDDSFTLYKLENPNKRLLTFHHTNKDICYLIDNAGNTLINWLDEKYENSILRKMDELMIIFKNNGKEAGQIELKYSFKRLIEAKKSLHLDTKIGSIDIETYKSNKSGDQSVYSAGWCVNNEVFTYYLSDPGCSDPTALIQKLFNDIYRLNYHNNLFYTHNLSNFDSIFIIDALTRNNCVINKYNIKPTSKDSGEFVSLKISKNFLITGKTGKIKVEKRTITIYDSALMLNGSLRELCKQYQCETLKGHFPYDFVTVERLNYIGETPAHEYFDERSLSLAEYSALYPRNYLFSVKDETLKYLKTDLLSLKELMLKFGKIIFEEFGVNITDFKTISGLSLHIFLSNFYNIEDDITVVKGSLETEIRKAYFGGLIHMNNEQGFTTDKGYFYDINSQYPSAMLNPMPTGNPVLSTDTDLDSYFGFCYAKIIPPKILDNYLIPYRREDADERVKCPSTPFSGIYFSELLKASKTYGYKIEIKGGIKFKKSIGIFDDFVNTLYGKRLKAKAENLTSFQRTLKLVLNSLYGRMGMKNIENKIEIVDKDKAESLFQKKNILEVIELHEKVMIKYNNNISTEILNHSKDLSISLIDEKFKPNSLAGLTKERGVPSSIPIAAAITAYAQIDMMKYKNIPGNKLLYSDTDSVLMENPLPKEYVNPNKLGMLKLENIIIEGFFIAPKFYCIKNSEGKLIIKTKGLSSGKITYKDFKGLTKGEDFTVKTTVFSKNLKKGTVNISERDYTIKGIVV